MSQDADYIRQLDSLARFYNSQATAHVGYFLTLIVLFCAFFNIIQPTIVEYLRTRFDSFVSLACVALIFLALLLVWIWISLPGFSPRYQLARTQFYMELSQIVWEHMGVNNPGAFELLKERTAGEYSAIQASILSLFEARLYRSLWKKEHEREPPEIHNGKMWMTVFKLSEHFFDKWDYEKIATSEEYDMFLPAYPKKRKILRIWKLPGFDYTSLLWTAHRRTIKSYSKEDPTFLLFKDF